jgi:putative transposase
MKYRFMQRYGSGFEVRKMCRVLGVNRSEYYAYLRRGLSGRHEEESRLVEKIRETWHGARGVYGAPRVTAELRARGDRHAKTGLPCSREKTG